MNDFTKEELEAMKYWCRENHELVSKINSMIDNYCEHEWNTNPHDFMLYCQKCGEIAKSDQQEIILYVNQ